MRNTKISPVYDRYITSLLHKTPLSSTDCLAKDSLMHSLGIEAKEAKKIINLLRYISLHSLTHEFNKKTENEVKSIYDKTIVNEYRALVRDPRNSIQYLQMRLTNVNTAFVKKSKPILDIHVSDIKFRQPEGSGRPPPCDSLDL